MLWGCISMANEGNLRPFNTMTPEQRREISRKGGKASGAARRRKAEREAQALAEVLAEKKAGSQLFHDCLALFKAAAGNPRPKRSRHKYIYRY